MVLKMEAGAAMPRLSPSVPASVMLENVRSALSRGLPQVRQCRPHEHELSIAAGGPSLQDTYKDLRGYIGAVNGSLSFLLDKGIVPHACGVLDANRHMAEIVVPHKDVAYYVASICNPAVFDRLKDCRVIVWHPSGVPGIDDVVGDRLQVCGGCTMGLRWINLGYVLGFRSFQIHGMDSSFRGGKTHAYPDRRDDDEHIEIVGYRTRLNFLAQNVDFAGLLARLNQPDVDPVKIEMHGDGLTQHCYRHWLAVKDRMSPQEAFQNVC